MNGDPDARSRPVGLSIAGSDSGGGAGVQMDLRVMQRLGVFAATAVTAVTAQNLDAVTDVTPLPAASLHAQLRAVLTGFDVAAIKTGMLWSSELIEVAADVLSDIHAPLVIDPVMVATSGARLLDEDAIASYAKLWPRARLVTPNLDEAEVLLGRAVDRQRLPDEARTLADRVECAVLVKGGHASGDPVDVLSTGSQTVAWSHARIDGANTHGSGCMLSAAIAAHLARTDDLVDACQSALAFTHDALARGALTQSGLADVERATLTAAHLRRRP